MITKTKLSKGTAKKTLSHKEATAWEKARRASRILSHVTEHCIGNRDEFHRGRSALTRREVDEVLGFTQSFLDYFKKWTNVNGVGKQKPVRVKIDKIPAIKFAKEATIAELQAAEQEARDFIVSMLDSGELCSDYVRQFSEIEEELFNEDDAELDVDNIDFGTSEIEGHVGDLAIDLEMWQRAVKALLLARKAEREKSASTPHKKAA